MEENKKTTMSPEQLEKAVNWIKEKLNGKKLICEICQNESWTVLDHLVTPIVYANGFHLGGNSYPQFMLACKRCSNTKYINAVSSGIIIKE